MLYSYSIIGGGAWGTALANAIAKETKKNVVIWVREKELVEEINKNKTNSIYLPNVKLSSNIYATETIAEAIAPIIFYVTPAQYFRECVLAQKNYLSNNSNIIICSKGIEEKTGCLLSNILDELHLNINYSILSGPSFASEVAKEMPVALVLAAKSLVLAEQIAQSIFLKQFRLYLSDDVIGVQAGGAIKNVYAIGSGIISGINFGKSSNAALISRAIVEMSRFCTAIGGRSETIFGLSGLGDAILTCGSDLSRNFMLGKQIGKGKNLNKIIQNNLTVAEGYHTIKAIKNIIEKYSIEMPILEAIYDVLYNKKDPKFMVEKLMSRPIKGENIL